MTSTRTTERRLARRLRRRRYHQIDPRRATRRGAARLLGAVASGEPAEGEAAELIVKQRDQMLRLQAEFENYRKRTKREIQKIKETASVDLVEKILPILDNFTRAVDSPGDSVESLVEGVNMIRNQLANSLLEVGLEIIEAEGETFDPNLHEAVMMEPSDDLPENTIVEILQPGYTIKGRLLRPAMVKVSSKA